MKKVIFLFMLAISTILIHAQIPQGFNYQAVVRTLAGGLLQNKQVKIKVAIQTSLSGGTVLWEEEHINTTSDLGLISFVVGTGPNISGTIPEFSRINWNGQTMYLKTSVQYPIGSAYTELGTTQIWSVPYSLIAKDVEGPVNKLSIKSTETVNDSALFKVINKDGNVVFAVYNEGVRVHVSDDTKGKKGGFAVGGFGSDKAESQPYMVVTADSIRMYLDSNPLTKKPKGGFAVGGYDMSKGIVVQNYLDVSEDSVRIYIDNNPLTKGKKGGFAVGGYDMSKGSIADFLNVSIETSGIINPSQNRILWYPQKNAFLTGKVLIEKSDSVGENSFAAGFESKAKGNYSQALGYKAIARGDYSTAIGKNAVASKLNSFAFGEGTYAGNSQTYALGYNTLAIGLGSFALGYNAKTLGQDAFAIGSGTEAIGIGSYAIGFIGRDSAGFATGNTKASGDWSVAIGMGAQAQKKGAFSLGTKSFAEGEYSLSIGYNTSAKSMFSTCIGGENKALGYGSIVLGIFNETSQNYTSAIGSYCKATANSSTAVGTNNTASGVFSTALGYHNLASGYGALAMGYYTTASGSISTSMGDYSIASGYRATAMGSLTIASGNLSTAMGNKSTAKGATSTAMGYNTLAKKDFTTAMGFETKSTGWVSTSLGYSTIAIGDISTSLGYFTKAKPWASLAIGQYNDTTCSASGTYSWVTTDPLFIIGNGTADNVRANAFTILKNGNTAIGHAAPTQKLDVNGNARFRLVGSGTYGYNLNITSDGTLTTSTSDISRKENIIQIHDALEIVSKLRGVYFSWKNDSAHIRQIGMIAQEVEPFVPEIVFSNPVDGLKGINYSQATAILVEAIKEQQKEIDELKSLVKKLISSQAVQADKQ